MAVPAATVKTICTRSEAELVRSSRPPRLGQLTLAEVKQLAARARKLSDKWSGQSRSQSRVQSRKAGLGESAKNTQLKAQAFRDALENFLAQVARLQAAPAAGGKKAGGEIVEVARNAETPRRSRGDEERTFRGKVSAERSGSEAQRPRKRRRRSAAPTPEQTAAPKPAAKPAAKKRQKGDGRRRCSRGERDLP